MAFAAQTRVPQLHCNLRRFPCPRGRTLGGSSSWPIVVLGARLDENSKTFERKLMGARSPRHPFEIRHLFVHLGTHNVPERILWDLRSRRKNWLRLAANDMAKTIEKDSKEYARFRLGGGVRLSSVATFAANVAVTVGATVPTSLNDALRMSSHKMNN